MRGRVYCVGVAVDAHAHAHAHGFLLQRRRAGGQAGGATVGRAKAGRAKVSVALHPHLASGDLRSKPPPGRASRTTAIAGGGQLSRYRRNPAVWQLAGRFPATSGLFRPVNCQSARMPVRIGSWQPLRSGWKPASGTSAALVMRTPLRMGGHGCAPTGHCYDAERYMAAGGRRCWRWKRGRRAALPCVPGGHRSPP
jgi:hypothetical protein